MVAGGFVLDRIDLGDRKPAPTNPQQSAIFDLGAP